MQTLMAQKLAAVGFALIEIDEAEPQLVVEPTMGRTPNFSDLLAIEPGADFIAEQPILNLRTGQVRLAVGQEFKVIDLVPSDDGDKKHTRVIIEVSSKQHNVSYGAVFRAIREPRPGDKTYETVSVKKEEPKASQALAPGMEFKVNGLLLQTNGKSLKLRKGQIAKIVNVIDNKSVAVAVTKAGNEVVFAVRTVSLLTSGHLKDSAKKALAA